LKIAVSSPAQERIVACAAGQSVITGSSIEKVGQMAAGDRVAEG
jgi:hypothetical protein